jgi:hypothetical protein
LAAGEIGFESDTGKIKIGTGSTAWNALAYTASSTAVTYLFNATGGQTTFSGTDANGLTLAYTVGAEQVYLNGVLQVRGSDYTATNGTSIVLASGALVSDVLNVIAFSALALSDTYTQAQADAKFFQTANAFLAGKNKIINGDFGIWQRGTTGTAGYVADRFSSFSNVTTNSISQQTFTPGTAPVAGYEGTYFIRQVITSGGTASSRSLFEQKIEDVRTLAGQTVTASFWAKADAAKNISIEVAQQFGSGGSAQVNTAIAKQAITTSWARYSFTFTVPSVAGKTIGAGSLITLLLWLDAGSDFNARTNSLGNQSGTFDFWGVQVEAGSIATPFQTATGTIQGELAACQRYYYRVVTNAMATTWFSSGFAYNTTRFLALVNLPVRMRVNPTSIETSGTAADYRVLVGSTIGTATAVPTLDTSNWDNTLLNVDTSGLTAGQGGILGANVTNNAYIGFNAEL